MRTLGISIFAPKSGVGVWNNGASQNVLFMAMLFRAAGWRVLILNGGDGPNMSPEQLPATLREFPWAKPAEVADELDVVIEGGAQLEAGLIAKVRERGGVAVSLKFGNALVIDAERAIHDKPAGAIFNGSQFDEIWTTSQHEPMCGSFWETCYRCPVRVLPHVWDPCFVDVTLGQLSEEKRVRRAPPAKQRIGMFAPNINIVKTAHIAMLVAERAYRMRPELFGRVYVTNSEHMKGRLPFTTFAANLDLFKTKADDGHPIMSFEARYNTPWFLSEHVDVVVDDAWIDTPNYLHYDTAYMGYPLVHNISELRAAGVGHYYSGFDAQHGAESLLRAMTEHDAEAQNKRAAVFLDKVRATNPKNVYAHEQALEQLGARETRAAA